MSRFRASQESQAAQLAGLPATTTFNGFFCALMAAAASNYTLRRVILGVRAGGVPPTSQQVTVAMYRLTVRPIGSGFSTVAGQNLDPRGPASVITGLDYTTAASAGTTGPTLAATPIAKHTFNLQSGLDIPWEDIEGLVCDNTANNGLALVNIGNALPASHLYTFDWEWEE